MRIAPDIIRYEFIGSEGKVVRSPHAGYVGLTGTVIGETRNTFTLLNDGQKRSVIKESAILDFKFADGTIAQIDGRLLVGRPEDRLKKSIKRLW